MTEPNKLWESWRREILILLLILGLALFLRIFKLTYLPIFGDEAIYIRWAQVMRAETTLRFVPLSDGKQPLFMWSVIPFLKIFRDPLFAGRSVSVLSGLMTTVGIFVLSYLLFKNKKISLFSSLIYSISPYSLFFDRMALVDSMLSMFGVWTFVFVLITVKKVRLDTAMLAGFALGGALLTKSPAIFFTILIPLTLVLSKWPKKLSIKFNKLCTFVFLFSFTYLIAFGLYNILRLGPNFHMVGIRNKDYIFPLSHILTSPFDPLKPFLLRVIEWFWKLGPSVFVFFAVIGIFRNFKIKPRETMLLLFWGLAPIFISAEFAKVFTARYIFYTFPYFVILAGLSSHAFKGASLQGKDKILKILFVVFVLHALRIDFLFLTNIEKAPLPQAERSGYLEEWTSGTGIREAADFIRGEYQNSPGEKIVVGTEGYFGTLPDGLQIYLNDLPEITVIGTGLDFKEIPIQLNESKKAGNKTYFAVNSSRLIANPDSLDLESIAGYPKAVRRNGTIETFYLFEVINQ